jgi:hypothetical protein
MTTTNMYSFLISESLISVARLSLGFPTGITGIALMARAYNQAEVRGRDGNPRRGASARGAE